MPFLFFVFLFLVSNQTYALPINNSQLPVKNDEPVANQDEAADFEGVIHLNICSGALARFEHSLDSNKALAMTNGHCIQFPNATGMMAADRHMENYPTRRRFKLLTKNGKGTVGTLVSNKVLYATLTGTDLALFELTQTYAEIEKEFNTKALVIDSRRSTEKEPMQILSGLFSLAYTCVVDKFVHKLKEGNYLWTDSLRYDKTCNTKDGTSGSPIVSKSKRKIIGINNTGNEDGQKCTMENPCEISETGEIFFEKGLNYGQQTYQVYSCFNADKKFDLTVPGCALSHEKKVTEEDFRLPPRNKEKAAGAKI